MMRMFRKQEGFTLIELLIVVIILGILAMLAIPRFMANRNSSILHTCAGNMRMVEDAIERYNFEQPSAATGVAQLVTQNYLKATPVCPAPGATYSIAGSNVSCSAHGDLATAQASIKAGG